MILKDNFIAKYLYRTKFYIDVARGRIGWVTGWLPEIVAVGLILQFFGFNFTRTQVLWFIPIFLTGLALTGYVYYKLGLYQLEVFTNAGKDPVQNEILKAARKINENKNND